MWRHLHLSLFRHKNLNSYPVISGVNKMIKQKECYRFIKDSEKDVIDFLLYEYILIMFYEYIQYTKLLIN